MSNRICNIIIKIIILNFLPTYCQSTFYVFWMDGAIEQTWLGPPLVSYLSISFQNCPQLQYNWNILLLQNGVYLFYFSVTYQLQMSLYVQSMRYVYSIYVTNSIKCTCCQGFRLYLISLCEPVVSELVGTFLSQMHILIISHYIF